MEFSSNNDRYNSDNRIYVVCRNYSGYDFQPFTGYRLSVYYESPNQECEPCVPQNKTELTRMVKNMEKYAFDQKYYDRSVKFWTDYERINATHFWSEIEKTWWSQCRSSELRRDFKLVLSVARFRSYPIEWALCEHQSIRDRVPNINFETRLSNPNFSKFPDSVMIDVQKKLRNVILRNQTGCICIGKVIFEALFK